MLRDYWIYLECASCLPLNKPVYKILSYLLEFVFAPVLLKCFVNAKDLIMFPEGNE